MPGTFRKLASRRMCARAPALTDARNQTYASLPTNRCPVVDIISPMPRFNTSILRRQT